MAGVLDVAAYVLKERGPMTAMKLQKLVYYSQAWHLVWEEVPLFPERIEAWANGPVVRELYEAHRRRLNLAGPEELPEGDPNALTPLERESVDAVLAAYAEKPAHWLSELTHRETPWQDARARAGLADHQRGDALIRDSDMFEYYDGLTSGDAEIV